MPGHAHAENPVHSVHSPDNVQTTVYAVWIVGGYELNHYHSEYALQANAKQVQCDVTKCSSYQKRRSLAPPSPAVISDKNAYQKLDSDPPLFCRRILLFI